MELGLVDCTAVLSRQLRRRTWVPDAVEEERTLLEALFQQAKKGSWVCLYELLLHQLARPGSLPLADDIVALLNSYTSQAELRTKADMLWSMYFSYLGPWDSRPKALALMDQARIIVRERPELIRMRCVVALDDYECGRQEQAIEELRRCQQEALPGTPDTLVATQLLAMLPHSGKDHLREPDPERLEQLFCLYIDAPELLADYLWQGIVCNEGTAWQAGWLKAMEKYPASHRVVAWMEGLLCLHGFGGRTKDVDKALSCLAQSARGFFLPALNLLADITGRGLCGCQAGPYQGPDWVAEGCEHLAPRALAVHGLLSMSSGDSRKLLTSTVRVLSATREDLFDWCGRQDQDCLCLACNAVFRLDNLVRDAAVTDSLANQPDVPDDDYLDILLEARAAGEQLCDALCLAQATADAGTFLYAGRELMRLVTGSREYGQSRHKDKRDAWADRTACKILFWAADFCLLQLTHMPRRKTRFYIPSLEPWLSQLVFFCLDRACFFGEPAARALRASLGQFMDLDRLAQDMEDANLNTPLRRFWCKTEHPVL